MWVPRGRLTEWHQWLIENYVLECPGSRAVRREENLCWGCTAVVGGCITIAAWEVRSLHYLLVPLKLSMPVINLITPCVVAILQNGAAVVPSVLDSWSVQRQVNQPGKLRQMCFIYPVKLMVAWVRELCWQSFWTCSVPDCFGHCQCILEVLWKKC